MQQLDTGQARSLDITSVSKHCFQAAMHCGRSKAGPHALFATYRNVQPVWTAWHHGCGNRRQQSPVWECVGK